MNILAFGCSHTYGTGVGRHEAWPALLNAENYGVEGCSTDYIVRTAPLIIQQCKPSKIYILWPDWTRFEYVENGEFKQSRPADKNRIHLMKEWTDEKLQNNFSTGVEKIKLMCNNQGITLVDMTLYDLIPIIDHADKWPLSKLGHHYSPVWHRWVADIFLAKEHEQT